MGGNAGWYLPVLIMFFTLDPSVIRLRDQLGYCRSFPKSTTDDTIDKCENKGPAPIHLRPNSVRPRKTIVFLVTRESIVGETTDQVAT